MWWEPGDGCDGSRAVVVSVPPPWPGWGCVQAPSEPGDRMISEHGSLLQSMGGRCSASAGAGFVLPAPHAGSGSWRHLLHVNAGGSARASSSAAGRLRDPRACPLPPPWDTCPISSSAPGGMSPRVAPVAGNTGTAQQCSWRPGGLVVAPILHPDPTVKSNSLWANGIL